VITACGTTERSRAYRGVTMQGGRCLLRGVSGMSLAWNDDSHLRRGRLAQVDTQRFHMPDHSQRSHCNSRHRCAHTSAVARDCTSSPEAVPPARVCSFGPSRAILLHLWPREARARMCDAASGGSCVLFRLQFSRARCEVRCPRLAVGMPAPPRSGMGEALQRRSLQCKSVTGNVTQSAGVV
jgi:hypothetical protein